MILKITFCEIMLMFVRTWHENDVPLVTVSFKSVGINFYLFISQLSLHISCADISIFPGTYPDYIAL